MWHAGEPLSVSTAFYEKAFSMLARFNFRNVRVQHLFQTNATLITQEWCEFFRAHDAQVCVSINGPQRFHDSNRVARNGRGSFEHAMRGVKLMQTSGFVVHNIAVLTNESLGYPDEIWEFFVSQGMTHLGFNAEEIEGIHTRSSMVGHGAVQRYRAFFRRLRELKKTCGQPVSVRELDKMEERIRCVSGELRSTVNEPLAILSFDCDGNMSTFSPELSAVRHAKYRDFKFGNVFACGVDDILENETFRMVYDDIQQRRREVSRILPLLFGVRRR